ncbi:hypothetical protein A4X13_0g7881 [Tilletia indica]|uniref:Uncharacterized protein n=1 Tax=Tilletia indica TaxID=43049 RepID=A0A177T4B9_9BASI|nr:hypothetical protein A4X13_0g7881 [Tilletia indica]
MITAAEQKASAASAREALTAGVFGARLTDAHWALITQLSDVRSQDAYDVATATLDRINKGLSMALPKLWVHQTVPVADVGDFHTGASFPLEHLAQVYALNKARCPDSDYAVHFGLLRMEAVKAGWVDTSTQAEIIFVDPLDDDVALRTLEHDLATFTENIYQVRTLAYLIPLIAEHCFRTQGHYWRTDKAEAFRYWVPLHACLEHSPRFNLPPELLYYEALHWTGPARQMQVLLAQLQLSRLPDALKTMASDTPASMADLICTARYIKALNSDIQKDKFSKCPAFDKFDLIKSVAAAVEKDPFKYHQLHFFYGVGPPTKDELTALRDATKAAVKVRSWM